MKKIIIALLCAIVPCTVALGNDNFAPNQQGAYTLDANTLKNSIVTVPAGAIFRGVFLSPVSSETAVVGQEVSIALSNDFFYKEKKVAPAGSMVTGTVIDVSKAKHGSINGKLTLRFTHIITPSGLDIPIAATVRTPDKTGIILGGSDLMVNVGGKGYSDSESIRTSYTPQYMAIGSGSAAAMNAAVETNGGSLLKSIWDKGVDVDISANTTVDLVLTQPITVAPTDNQNE